jgi:isoamylase
MQVELGRAWPQGASWDGAGVNFALYSSVATRVEVCLYDAHEPLREVGRFDLPANTAFTWHGYVPGLTPGTLYGLRVHGPWAPERGHRCNPQRLLVDPYAKALIGEPHWHPLEAHSDSAPYVPRAQVVNDQFDWEGDRALHTPWDQTVIYELHVRGFSKRQPALPPSLRGTYAGLGHAACIEHLQRLGVTAVELLPVHAFVDDAFLVERGLTNYWGYSTLSFFAPAQRYAHQPRAVVDEFKSMVKALHRAGLEVILDVVYNHTCEGDQRGPTLSLKGVDNASYYALRGAHYRDVSGCGNSVDASKPAAARLIRESLRYWASEMHVDGFRFDLATTLGRDGSGEYAREQFESLVDDPALAGLKLIAEPWDLGPAGYQRGNFPAPVRDWNDRFRDGVRRLWRGDTNPVELGDQLSETGINYVTSHDGFTLRDVVSFERKQNLANGEHNRDGSEHEVSWNEAPGLRARQQRNLLATLMLSRGVPMLLAGDELGRSQHGNNNPYCQDNEVSWLDWELDPGRAELLLFTQRLLRFRKRHPCSRPPLFCLPDQSALPEHAFPRAFVARYDDVLVLINADAMGHSFVLPEGSWKLALDTSGRKAVAGTYPLAAHALALFTRA